MTAAPRAAIITPMDRDEALKLLKGGEDGIEELNNWRNVHPDDPLPDLRRADLSGADLRFADLRFATLCYAALRGADLADAYFISTVVACDLSQAKGLTEVNHLGPSVGCLEAAKLSNGPLPDQFLRGCGL